MPYTAPTLADFRARFPEYPVTSVSDESVNLLLTEAGRQVDDTWTEGDYKIAILYLTAHYATIIKRSVATGGSVDQVVRQVRFRDRTVVFGYSGAVGAGSDQTSSNDQTLYGQLFEELLQRNIPAILVI